MPSATISADRVIDVPVDRARDWFLSLKDHPERYRFATHEGIEFVQGNFGEVGARFKTREKFFFLKLELLFELVEVTDASFRFKLLRPSWLHIWGVFTVRALDPESAYLKLEIGSSNRQGQLWLRFYPVTAAVRQQITKEVVHIKESMEDRSRNSDGI